MNRHYQNAAAVAAVLALSGCWTTPAPGEESLEVAVPDAWSGSSSPAEGEIGLAESGTLWWTTFGEPSLDQAMDDVLASNFELREAWARLAESSASAAAAGAPRIPTIDLNGSAQRFDIDQSGGGANQIPLRLGETFSLGPSLSYEVDLFGRIDSALKAARLGEAATAADFRATALTLSGRATEAWITAAQNQALAALVKEQIGVSEQLLKVTENRFATGSGSVLDVLQQKRQLAATRAELPSFRGQAERAVHSLNVLRARAPRDREAASVPSSLPALPPLPILDVPTAILKWRPDVTAALFRVEQADANVAAAVADRYPRLSLTGSYNFDGNELSALFDRTITSIVASLALPLIDGGGRRAEVRRRRAQLDGTVAALQRVITTALQEVEDALSSERRGRERLAALEEQFKIASDELAQAKRRYAGGVGDYLQVLTAVQSLQTLERQVLSDRGDVLRSRATLLRALGGAWLDQLPPPSRDDSRADS